MTGCIRASLSVLMLVAVAASQSLRSNISCPGGETGEACRSFKDAIEDEDKHIVEAVQRRDHVVICFRPNEDVFLLLSYDSPRRGLWRESAERSGVEQAGTVDFTRFRNGNANFGGESLFADGLWSAPSVDDGPASRFSGTSLVPGDDGAVRIDSSGVRISHSFRDNWDDPMTRYEFSMKSSADVFAETFALAATSNTATHDVKISGKCLIYK